VCVRLAGQPARCCLAYPGRRAGHQRYEWFAHGGEEAY
jgi:hypothetical protein